MFLEGFLLNSNACVFRWGMEGDARKGIEPLLELGPRTINPFFSMLPQFILGQLRVASVTACWFVVFVFFFFLVNFQCNGARKGS